MSIDVDRRVYSNQYYLKHKKQVNRNLRKHCRKGGKYYLQYLAGERVGVRRAKNKVRYKHGAMWRKYKNIIAPGSQIHHEWIPGTSDYRGVALVEADQHMHGIIDVIEILKGRITLVTEKEIRNDRR